MTDLRCAVIAQACSGGRAARAVASPLQLSSTLPGIFGGSPRCC